MIKLATVISDGGVCSIEGTYMVPYDQGGWWYQHWVCLLHQRVLPAMGCVCALQGIYMVCIEMVTPTRSGCVPLKGGLCIVLTEESSATNSGFVRSREGIHLVLDWDGVCMCALLGCTKLWYKCERTLWLVKHNFQFVDYQPINLRSDLVSLFFFS